MEETVGDAFRRVIQPELVKQEQIKAIAAEIQESLWWQPVSEILAAVLLCESPIELQALRQIAKVESFHFPMTICAVAPAFPLEAPDFPIIVPQVVLSGARVDFMVYGNGKACILECDGADFHDQMKDQWRDQRFMSSHRLQTWRLSGSEIMRSPAAIETAMRSIAQHLFG